MNERPIVIRRVGTVEEADLVVAWLDNSGVKATVFDRNSPGTLAFGVTDEEGVAICVKDEATALRAKELLEQHDRQRAQKHAGSAEGGDITASCEACSHLNTFSAEQRGTVQECAKCSAHMDVPSQEA